MGSLFLEILYAPILISLLLHTNTISLGCFSLIGAILCAVLSVAIFVGTREDEVIKGVVLASVALFVFPVASLIWSIKGE